jgi:hypothetical protein
MESGMDMDIAFQGILSGAGTAGDRFRRCLERCRAFLESTSPADLFDRLIDDPDRGRTMASLPIEATHIGFIVPPRLLSVEDMNREAERAGYGPEFNSFRSVIVAHELGTLSGSAPVTTRIQAFGLTHSASPSAHVEVFLPDTDADSLARWIEVDVCTHVGFTLPDASAFPEISGVLRQSGFEIPGFMNGRPLINEQAGIGVVYFDTPGPVPRRRIEFLFAKAPAA